MWFIELDNDNRPIGFYPEDHQSIPASAVKVDDKTKSDIFKKINNVRLVNKSIVNAPNRPDADMPLELKNLINKRKSERKKIKLARIEVANVSDPAAKAALAYIVDLLAANE